MDEGVNTEDILLYKQKYDLGLEETYLELLNFYLMNL